MATISSVGVGSNLDLASLLTQLQTAESQPLTALDTKAKSFTSKLTAYGTVQSALSTLQTAAQKLSDPALFQTVTGTPTVSGILAATSTDPSSAGNYTIKVSQLAQAQSMIATGQASATTAIGSGKITIDFGTITGGTLDAATGTYTGSGFTAYSSRTAKSLTIDSPNNTLTGIRDAINAANAGVTASIVNDGSGTPYRLVLNSTTTGETSSMRISVNGDAALQSLMGNDPAGTQNLKQTVAAQNAKLDVNGIAITSTTNTVKEAIQGTTLTLVQTGTTGLSMKANTSTVTSAINDFVKAYNSLQSTAKSLTAYDTDTNTGGALVGDTTLRNIMNRVRQVLATPQSTGANDLKVLNEIGVAFQKDGTLLVDSTKLASALDTNLEGVSNLFASGTGSTSGFGKQLDSLITDFTKTGGSLSVATDGVTATIKDLDEQYNTMQARVDATMARYRTQFTALDVLVSSMKSTQTYLTQQFDAMNSSSSK
ncbi:flagellar filament capping protein FliD [Variovorax ureilyticus]|uniref:Flagellar hook-associated protein 2 n=1 Tax=Variovorax ureilyticus TaxID=1836198 RepID=A0ABU8VCR8_9BURK